MTIALRGKPRFLRPGGRRLICIAAIAVAIALPAARAALGQGAFVLLNERNHPELRWQEIQSDHFRIIYHDPLELWAREAASILERFHAPLCRRLDTYPERRTRVYLSDQDQIANGAAVGHDYFFVWIPSYASTRSFSGMRPWFEEVLIHEYTHVLVARASRTWLGNLAYPLGLYPPRWLHEGIAQWTAEDWNVYRGDRTLAAAVLDGSIERHPAGVPGAGRLLYARGHARVRWLASVYGDSTIPRLARAAGPLGIYTYDTSQRRALGKHAAGALDRFRREIIAHYGDRFRAGEPSESLGAALDLGIRFPQALAAGRDESRWIAGQRTTGPGEASLFRRLGDEVERIIPGSVTGRPLPLDNGGVLSARFHRASHGSWIADLGLWDPGDGFRFVGSDERVGEIVAVDRDRILVLLDSSAGPSLELRALGESGAPVSARALHRWPRGTLVHSIAVSSRDAQVLWSEIGPGGERRRFVACLDSMRAGSTLLESGRVDERDNLWLGDSTIAWTSHRDGRSQVRTAIWSPRDGLRADVARSAAGVGIAAFGVDRDSLLVLDFSSRRRTSVLRIDPDRSVRAEAPPPPPFHVEASVLPEEISPIVSNPRPYRPVREIRPWLRVPLAGPQSRRLALGGAGIWAEPLLKHALGGYVYGNDRQITNPDRGIFYLTTRWGPYLTVYHASHLHPRRLIDHELLTERREMTGIAILQPIHADDPNRSGWIDIYAHTDSRLPRFGGRRLSTPLGSPVAWSSLVLGGGWGTLKAPPHARRATGPSEGDGLAIRFEGGASPWPAARRYFRGAAEIFRTRPAKLPGSPALHFEAEMRGVSAGIAPQEFEGFDSDPTSKLLGGWPGLEGTVFLRGWPEPKASRFVARAAAELRYAALPDFGVRGFGMQLGGGTIAPFLELGHAWGRPAGRAGDARARTTCGVEARLAGRIGPLPVLPAVAWGFGFGRHAPEGSWSVRLTTALPFQMPYDPPRAFRSILQGGLASDRWTAQGPEGASGL